MADNFETALKFTLQWEGGFANDPRDPGGATNMGITIATLSHELGRPATIGEVIDLSRTAAGRARVADIYRKKYWNTIGGNRLPPGIDLLAFDIAVNSGPGRALQWLDATHNLTPVERLHALDKKRRGFWRHLKIFARFGSGWFRREDACLALALKLAGA
jgi:lysozyme family protein